MRGDRAAHSRNQARPWSRPRVPEYAHNAGSLDQQRLRDRSRTSVPGIGYDNSPSTTRRRGEARAANCSARAGYGPSEREDAGAASCADSALRPRRGGQQQRCRAASQVPREHAVLGAVRTNSGGNPRNSQAGRRVVAAPDRGSNTSGGGSHITMQVSNNSTDTGRFLRPIVAVISHVGD